MAWLSGETFAGGAGGKGKNVRPQLITDRQFLEDFKEVVEERCQDCGWQTALGRLEAVQVAEEEVRALCWSCFSARDWTYKVRDKVEHERTRPRKPKPKRRYTRRKRPAGPRPGETWLVDFSHPYGSGTLQVRRMLNSTTQVHYWQGAPKVRLEPIPPNPIRKVEDK